MRDQGFFRAFLVVALLATVIIFSPVVVMAYGGNDGPSDNSGSGASISSSSVSSYFPWADGINNQATYEAAVTRATEAEEAERGPYGYTSSYTERYYDNVHAGLGISRAAWDESFDVSPGVRRFAMILEQMMMAGTLEPRQAFNLLAVYNLTRQRNLRR